MKETRGPLRPEAVVELHGAAVQVDHRRLWSDVDLALDSGDFLAVLGPNGVGKTTLIKAILGLLPVMAGTVRVLGKPPGQENHRIGYLPQRRSLDPGLRIRGVDLVRLGLDGDRWGVPVPGARFFSAEARARDAHVRDVLDLVGASAYAHQPIGEVSGGEQQRLLIAQALVRDPALLLLDEPLEGLDLQSQASITSLIGRICKEQNIAVMIVAHDVNPLLPHVDLVAYVGEGRIVTRIEVVRTAEGRLAVLGQQATCGPGDESCG
jgi:zinc/manganese transport system ATP-binding protein